MYHVTRISLLLLLTTLLAGMASSQAMAKDAEYKRADQNFYWKGDVLKVDPNAIILAKGSYTEKGDLYLVPDKKKNPKDIYIQVENDWVEPITPPDMPASLGVPPLEMQIREPQGDVTVAFPSAPATFVPVKDGMTIPNGAVIHTGANGTAAVLFGGVDSIRLIPNTSVAVQQDVTATLRTTEINLTKGAVFSKVGTRPGEKQDYQVKTPFGVAAARGTDFVTVAMPARTDVWIAQGTVQLDSPDGKMVGMVKSDGAGALKIIRFPIMTDLHDAMMASSQTMTAAMDFIPMANVKIKALKDRMAKGEKLTANELDYMKRIKQVPCLIKLVLVEAPVAVPALVLPPPAPVVKPAPPAPAPVPAPAPAPVAPAAALTPIDLDLRADGKVDFQGTTQTLDALKLTLADVAKNTPTQPIVVKGKELVSKDQFAKVHAVIKGSKLKNVTMAKAAATTPVAPEKPKADAKPTAETPKPSVPEKAKPEPASTNAPAATPPAKTEAKSEPTKPAAKPADKPADKPVDKPAAKVKTPPPAPLEVVLQEDGKALFQGSAVTIEELKPKLEAVAKATPDQPIVVKRTGKSVKGQTRQVVDLCKAAKLPVTVVKTAAPKTETPVATPETKPAPAKTEAKPAPVKETKPAPKPVDTPVVKPVDKPTDKATPAKDQAPIMQLPLNTGAKPSNLVATNATNAPSNFPTTSNSTVP